MTRQALGDVPRTGPALILGLAGLAFQRRDV
jgi:hypothetical protein